MFTCQQHFNKSITFEQVTTFQHVNNISTRQQVDMLPDGVSAHVRRLSVLHLQGHDAQGPDVNLVCTFICIFIFVFVYLCFGFYLYLYLYFCLYLFVFVLCSFTKLWCSKFHLGVICLLVHNLGRKIRSKVDLCKNCCFRPLVLKETVIFVKIVVIVSLDYHLGAPLFTSGAIQ